jgi:hypothetical protein
VLENDAQLDAHNARRDGRDFVALDARVNQVFFDDGETAGEEFLAYRIEHGLRCNAPRRNLQLMQARFGWYVGEANSDWTKLLQCIHREDLDAQLWPALDAASGEMQVNGMRKNGLLVDVVAIGGRLSFRLTFDELPQRA